MSLHHGDWLKLLGGAVLAASGLGLAGAGPLAGALGGAGAASAGAGATGAAGTGASLGGLLGPSLISTGLGTAASGAMGTPSEKMTSPVGVPQMEDSPDPLALFDAIKRMKHGGLS